MVGRVHRVAGKVPPRTEAATTTAQRCSGNRLVLRGRGYGHAVDLALYHLACGDIDQAFDPITLLAEQRHTFLMMIVVGGPYR